MTELAHLLSVAFAASSDESVERVSALRASDVAVPYDPDDEHDRVLVQQIRGGDESAFEQLFHEYALGLAAFVDGYVHDAAVAEELVQDTFLWIVSHRSTWSVRGTIRSYLYKAARNHALNYLKHRAVETRWTIGAGAPAPDELVTNAEGDDRLIAEERVTILTHAIARLPESRRAALTLRWMQGLSYAEIAAVLGSSTKAVEIQLNRTLRQLRQLLDGRV